MTFYTAFCNAKDTRAEFLYNAGIECYEKEEYANAMDFFLKCMEVAKESNERYFYCQSLNCIGYVYIRIDDVDRGIYYL